MRTLITKRAAVLAMMVMPVFAGNDNYYYLALGDSIAFGYDPTLVVPNEKLPKPDKFIGYPEVVAKVDKSLQEKEEVNAACPGQTSKSFLIGGMDVGCEGFKSSIGLHTMYSGTQDTFATSELIRNKKINLVTLGIGGNDLTLLQQDCGDPTSSGFGKCVEDGLPLVLGQYGANLGQILFNIRYLANYQGTLVIVNNYVPNADPRFIQAVAALNQVMVEVGTDPRGQFQVKFADVFTAFQLASSHSNGDPCKAGLVISLGDGSCDVHPSKRGREVIAAAVEIAINAKGNGK